MGLIRTAQEASLTAGSLSFVDPSPTIDFELGDFVNSAAPLLKVGTLSLNGTVTLNLTGGRFMQVGTISLIGERP